MTPANAPNPPLTPSGKLLFTLGVIVPLVIAYATTAVLEEDAKLPGTTLLSQNRTNLLVLVTVMTLLGRSAVTQFERGTLQQSLLKSLLPFVEGLILSAKDFAPTCFAILLAVAQSGNAETWSIPSVVILFLLMVGPISIGVFLGDGRLRLREHFSHAVLVELVVCVVLVACGWIGTSFLLANPKQPNESLKPLLLPATTLGIVGAVAGAAASLSLAKVRPWGIAAFATIGSLVGGWLAVSILKADRPETLTKQLLCAGAVATVVAVVCLQAIRRVNAHRFNRASVALTCGIGLAAGALIAQVDRPASWFVETVSFTAGIVVAAIALEFLLGCAWVRTGSIDQQLPPTPGSRPA